jgi:hypothetical protein
VPANANRGFLVKGPAFSVIDLTSRSLSSKNSFMKMSPDTNNADEDIGVWPATAKQEGCSQNNRAVISFLGALSPGLDQAARGSPYAARRLSMSEKTTKTKAQLLEMLAQAVHNTPG